MQNYIRINKMIYFNDLLGLSGTVLNQRQGDVINIIRIEIFWSPPPKKTAHINGSGARAASIMSEKREHTVIHVADNSRGTGTPNQARSAFLSRRKVRLIRYTSVQVVPLHRVNVETTQSFFTEDVTSQSYLIDRASNRPVRKFQTGGQ